MSYYIREREEYCVVVDENDKFYSKHKTRFSASNSLFKRMVKDRLRKRKKKVVIKS